MIFQFVRLVFIVSSVFSRSQSHCDNHEDVVDLLHIADMDESYGTYVDYEYFDNYDYDDVKRY